MGRIIAFDIGVKSILDKLSSNEGSQTYLIVGQHTALKDFAIHLCPVPPKEEEKPADESAEASASDKPKQPLGKKKQKNSEDVLELDNKWICHFAKEVTRTLPGGIEVLGFFVFAPTDTVNKLQQQLRQVLFDVFKVLGKDQELAICFDVHDRVLLHYCSVSKKFLCRTYDVSNTKSTPNPAEWKQLPSNLTWLTLHSELAVDLKFAVSSDGKKSEIKVHIDSALSPYFRNIMNAVAVINGSVRAPEDPLLASKSKHKSVVNQEQMIYDIDLLIPLIQKDAEHSKTSPCSLMLTFKGTMHCRGFVHNKATVQEAIMAIKQDVIRSITARCEIHCEDLLVIEEEQQDPVVVYELPKRVFVPLMQSGIQVCDYQFHGETASDSLTAFKELLNLDLIEEDVEACELAPATSDLIQSEVMEDRLSEFGDTPPAKNSVLSVLFPAVSAAIAVFAAGLSYFFYVQDLK